MNPKMPGHKAQVRAKKAGKSKLSGTEPGMQPVCSGGHGFELLLHYKNNHYRT